MGVCVGPSSLNDQLSKSFKSNSFSGLISCKDFEVCHSFNIHSAALFQKMESANMHVGDMDCCFPTCPVGNDFSGNGERPVGPTAALPTVMSCESVVSVGVSVRVSVWLLSYMGWVIGHRFESLGLQAGLGCSEKLLPDVEKSV